MILRSYPFSGVSNTLPNKYYNILKVKIQYVESDFHNILHKKQSKIVICTIWASDLLRKACIAKHKVK